MRLAGAIFCGHYACEAIGDYCAGPNHVLPTGRTARFSSPLGVYDFQKRTSVLRVSEAGARALAPIASVPAGTLVFTSIVMFVLVGSIRANPLQKGSGEYRNEALSRNRGAQGAGISNSSIAAGRQADSSHG